MTKNTIDNTTMTKNPLNILKVYHQWTNTRPSKGNVEKTASRLASQYSSEELRLASIMSNVWQREKGDLKVDVKLIDNDNDGGAA
jgi:hypothetical protein